MANALSKDAVQFQANADPVYQELGKIDKRLNDFKARVESMPAPSLSLSSIPGVGFGVDMVQSFFSGMYSATKGWTAFFIAELTKAANDARSVLKASVNTGLDTRTIGGIRFLGNLRGFDSEALGEGFRHYQMSVGNALAGNETAIASFRRVGITMDELRGHTPEEVFYRVADAVQSIQDPMRRTLALHDILGRRGAELGRVFMEGSAGIRAARAEAERMGIALDPVRTQQAASGLKAYREAVVRLESIMRGLATVIMAELGPILERGAKLVSEWASSWTLNQEAVKNFVRDAVLFVGKFWDSLIDFLSWLIGEAIPSMISSFAAFNGQLTIMASFAENLGRAAGRSGNFFENFGQQVLDASGANNEFIRGARDMAETLRGFRGGERGVRNLFAGMDTARGGSGRNPEMPEPDMSPLIQQSEHLRDALIYWGLTAEQVMLVKLRQQRMTDGQRRAIEQQVEYNDIMSRRLDMLTRQKRIQEEGQQTTQASLSGWEKINTEIGNVQQQFAQGAISQETYARTISRLYRDLESSQGSGERKFADAMVRGSKEEATLLIKARYGNTGESVQERIRRIQEEALDQQRRQTDIDQQILDAVRASGQGSQLFVYDG